MLYAAALLAAAWHSRFAMLSNDVFPLRWQAAHLSLHHPETFYDGFFPIGYPLLLRLASISRNPILALMLAQIVIAPVFVLFAMRLLRALIGKELSILALPFLLFAPQTVRAVLSVTPDFAAASCVLASFYFFTRGDSDRNIFIAGILMGVGYLFRMHIIVLAVSVALALFIFEKGRGLRSMLWYCAGVIPFVAVQGVLQVWSGHGFFENAQAFNLWRTMYGVDWNNPPALGGVSAFEIIRANPPLFFAAYWRVLIQESLYILPAFVSLLFLLPQGRTVTHRALTIFTFAALIYLLLTAIGGSPRNVAPVLPIIVANGLFVITLAFERGRILPTRAIAKLFAAFLWAAAMIGVLVASNHSARRVEEYTEVGRLLKVHSQMDALKIYTDDFDFYFPGLRYRTPRVSGGWQEVGLPDYLKEFPQLHDSSPWALHYDLVRNGIRWAMFRTPPYDARGYESARSDTALFRLTYQTPKHKIYRVE